MTIDGSLAIVHFHLQSKDDRNWLLLVINRLNFAQNSTPVDICRPQWKGV